MAINNIRVFIPCKDFEASQAFYYGIGFELSPASEELMLCRNGECFVFLQKYYNKEFAENLMLQVCVDDIEEAYRLASNSKFKAKISEITQEHWGKVFYLWGPSGELLHMTELNS